MGGSEICRGDPRLYQSGLLAVWASATPDSIRPHLHLSLLWAGHRPRSQRRQEHPAARLRPVGIGATIPAFGLEALGFIWESCHVWRVQSAQERAATGR